MRLYLPLMLCFVLAGGIGCRSSRETTENPSNELQSQGPPNAPKPPITAVTQNGSSIEAVVENLEDLGATQFNLKIFVLTSTPVNGRTSIVEEGQRIIVTPQYYTDSTGRVNFEDARNKRILSLKLLKVGQSFKGKIAINRQGSWNIVDVEDSK